MFGASLLVSVVTVFLIARTQLLLNAMFSSLTQQVTGSFAALPSNKKMPLLARTKGSVSVVESSAAGKRLHGERHFPVTTKKHIKLLSLCC